MSTPTQTVDPATRPELLALIAAAAGQLITIWRSLPTAQTGLLRRLGLITPSVGSDARIRRALADFNLAVSVFDRDAGALVERWAARDLPLAYRDGALRALRAASRDAALFTWSAAHQETITGITAVYWADLMRRITETVRRAQAFARAAADAARAQQGIDVTQLLDDHPLHRVVYANDARHPVQSWARSALHAQAITTANHGAIRTSVVDLNAPWLQCVDGPECGFVDHPDTDHADGTIRSAADATTFPIAHPGCIRSWIPRPDLTGHADITSGDPA